MIRRLTNDEINELYGRVGKIVYHDFSRQLMDRDKEDYVQEIVMHCMRMGDYSWTTIRNKAIDIYRKYLNHEGRCEIWDSSEVETNDGYDLSQKELVTVEQMRELISERIKIYRDLETDIWRINEYNVALKILDIIMMDICERKTDEVAQRDLESDGKKYRGGKIARSYICKFFPDYHPMTITEGYKRLQEVAHLCLG